MFAKKRRRPWFIRAMMNLAVVAIIYRLARGFQKHALKMGVDRKYKGRQ